MKVQRICLGRRVFGIELDGKLTIMSESAFDEVSGVFMYGTCQTDVRRHNSIRIINTGGTSAQSRIQLFNSSSRWSE